ncbi:MAG: L-lactate utilization operon repressor [Candidatus Accumulibacter regalis]|jgi:GntR family transcriptional repressor for pyruvate dehydrogenase complex|uniref:L-lactate utilization operon repressor n=1 Tax=Accumulibacter regalis TaxID=522306 RepID=A0A011QE46_ACCRE|nr:MULTISPECIES: FadR/GntR family transcriptional regulator [unclassified Candidatus Accumulibacter]EXI87612.1 MAG: L-lactate utilization operon repressor [Candidatus Accumulibacter regalis]MQM35728.1 FadR family transcriptional regulator [Candidatus Accumulibacter phosphatis]MBL8367554.1 FadR family transcriptional regulator [Accumulibacter sp.]MBN8512820.1 FadR family transcriptional regulator [Accumulibacter sp.]HRE69640.1 FadR/GntR family transcriptional regulator [Accumulibacter sp.]
MLTNELKRIETKRIVRRPRLSEEVSIALEGQIARGEIKPGEQLPVEKALAETFGVSRAVIREAVARLKADGRVETRQGAGAFVALVPKSLNFRFWQGDGPALVELREIFELRAMIESSIAELAARRRLPADIVAIECFLHAMDDALASGSDGSEADDDFHLAIAAATHNSYTRRLVEFLGRHFSESRRLAWTMPGRNGALPEEAQAEHRLIFAAVAAGEPARARRHSHEHVRCAARRVGIVLADDLVSGRAAERR